MTRNPIPDKNLRSLYHQLLSEGRRHRIPPEDAEELANDTLMTVIEKYDETRGPIGPFSRTVLLNKIRNFVRDRKIPPVHPDGDDHFIEDDDPETLFTREEDRKLTAKIREKLISRLDAREAEFLLHFEIVLDELGSRAVSETARRLHISPQEGHNIIQRIERKAKSLLKKRPEFKAPAGRSALESLHDFDQPAFLRKMISSKTDRMAVRSGIFQIEPEYLLAGRIARAGMAESKRGLEKFLASLETGHREKLFKLLS